MEVLLALVLLGLVAWFVSRPLVGRASVDDTDGVEDPRIGELEARKEAKYREIRDAELDRAAGKLSEEDFDRQDAELRGEAIEILRELDRVEEDRDPAVKARLTDPTDAGPAVLAWMVEGAIKWQQDRLQEPKIVREATQAYQSENEVFSEFVSDHCVEEIEQWAPSVQLHTRYRDWSHVHGYKRPYGPKQFGNQLRGRGHIPEKRGGIRGWKGIGLAPPKPVVTAMKKSA